MEKREIKFKISVIIPVFNSERFIERCLNSILSQTLEDLEIICIDDGSVDKSLEILNGYAEKYKNIVVLSQENSGPSVARNRGIREARGKYIAFVDSDDFIEPQMYSEMFCVAEKNNLNVVMCNYINDYQGRDGVIASFDLPKNQVFGKEEIKELIYPYLMRDSQYNGPCNKIYLRDFVTGLKAKMPENLRYGEDLIFQLEMYDKLKTLYFLDKPFYHYVHRGNSLSVVKSGMLESTFIPMYEIRKRYAEKWGISSALVAEHFCYYAIMDFLGDFSLKGFMAFIKNRTVSKAIALCDFKKENYTKKVYAFFKICKIIVGLRRKSHEF